MTCNNCFHFNICKMYVDYDTALVKSKTEGAEKCKGFLNKNYVDICPNRGHRLRWNKNKVKECQRKK